MNELIKITEHNGKQAVSARDLHEFLGSKRDFSNWIKDRIKKYDLIENQDYVSLNNFGEQTGQGGHNKIEYALSLDCAKELAMVEGNAKGKQARKYFIECEKELREKSKPMSTLDILEMTIKGLRENQQDLQEVKQDIKELKAKTSTRPDYFTIVGFGSLNNISVNLSLASRLGQKASRLCKDRGIDTDTIPDPRFGQVKMYPKEVLKEVFETVRI